MHDIHSHEDIVPECKGCKKIFKLLNGRFVCNHNGNVFPRTKWWFGEKCPQATHIDNKDEDPYVDI